MSSEYGLVFSHPVAGEFSELAWATPQPEPNVVFAGSVEDCNGYVERQKDAARYEWRDMGDGRRDPRLEVRRLVGARSLYELTEPIH